MPLQVLVCVRALLSIVYNMFAPMHHPLTFRGVTMSVYVLAISACCIAVFCNSHLGQTLNNL